MIRTTVIFLAFLITGTMWQQVSAQRSYSSRENAVNRTVVDFFEAMSNADTILIKSLATADFMLLENGEIWSMQMLVGYMKGIDLNNFKRTNKMEFIRTDVSRHTAWTAYDNRARITASGKTRDLRWLESAVLQKEKGKWKIKMLHSTHKPETP